MTRILLAAIRRIRLIIATGFYTSCLLAKLWMHGAKVGKGLRATGPINLYIHRSGNLYIGDRCRLNSGFAMNPVGGEGRLGIWVNAGGTLEIGDGTGMSNATIVCFQSIAVGREAFIGGGCRIYDTNFHPLDAAARVNRVDGVHCSPIVIGARAFIGGHSLVLKGTTIGEEAIVGAGSVVSGVVPAREIWAGNPARFVRRIT